MNAKKNLLFYLTKFNQQDRTCTEFSTVEVAACMSRVFSAT
jgi:hypothetical protein